MSDRDSKKFKSIIWEHFEMLEEGQTAKCKTCLSIVKRKLGNTSNLWSHLKNNHRNLLKDLQQRKGQIQAKSNNTRQPAITSCFATTSKYASCDDKQVAFDKAIMNFIVKDLRPFSVVSGHGFKEMIEVANPRLVVKDRTTFSRQKLPQLLEEMQEKVKEHLHSDKETMMSAAFTTDIWTSRANDSFLSLTLHYIDKEFDLCSWTLDCCAFEGSHTAMAIKQELDKKIEALDLPAMCEVFAIHDNGANMVLAAEISEHIDVDVRCCCHTLQLAIKDAFKVSMTAKVSNMLG